MNRIGRAAWRAMAMLAAVGAAGAFAQASAPAQADTQDTPQANACKPEYPEKALRAGAQGVSVVEFHVDANGAVTSAEVLRSAGHLREHRLLDQATVRALSACRFTPARDADGHPVAGVVVVPYRWLLD